jgi:hypothetical protein
MLFRSLGKALQKNGKIVTQLKDAYLDELSNVSQLLSEDDMETGWIYILRSKSSNKKIADIANLFKIGFSTSKVKDRIKYASKEATYLFAEVEIMATYKCYNLNAQRFENLLHRFFGDCCLNLDVFDDSGNRYTPREWFVVPLNIIEQAIALIINGNIINYKYSRDDKQIVAL